MAVCPDVRYNTLDGMGGIIRFLDTNYCAHPTSICESLLFIQPSEQGLAGYFVTQRLLRL